MAKSKGPPPLPQIPSRLEFIRESSNFAEAFTRTLPLVFGPLIIHQWLDHKAWSDSAIGWGAVCRFASSPIDASHILKPTIVFFFAAPIAWASLRGPFSVALVCGDG